MEPEEIVIGPIRQLNLLRLNFVITSQLFNQLTTSECLKSYYSAAGKGAIRKKGGD